MVRTILLFLFGLLWLNLSAQREERRFVHLTIEDGLSQNAISSIVQDKDGFIWFGTKDGLNRYDGYNFTIFKSSIDSINSLSANVLTSLAVDSMGSIWIGTNFGTLDKYDPYKNEFTHFSYNNNPNANAPINDLLIQNDSILWVATKGNGLYRVNTITNELRSFSKNDSLPSKEIRSITLDQENRLWIGYERNGLGVYDFNTKKITKHFNYLYKQLPSQETSKIRTLMCDTYGRIWVGTDGGAYIYEEATDQFKVIINPDIHVVPRPAVSDIIQQGDDKVWIAIYALGLAELDMNTLELNYYTHEPCNPYSLSGIGLAKLFVDRSNNLWIGTNGLGVDRLNANNNFNLYRSSNLDPNSLTNNSIRAIVKDNKGKLYIGSYGGLSIFNNQDDTYYHFGIFEYDTASLTLENNAVHSLLETRDGKIWIGYEGRGIEIYDPTEHSLTELLLSPFESNDDYNLFVYDLYQDPTGDIWVGSNFGLTRFDIETQKLQQFLYEPDLKEPVTIYDITNDDDKHLWLATDAGLIYFDLTTKDHRLFNNFLAGSGSTGNIVAPVNTICKRKPGEIWLGTSGLGIIKMTYSVDRLNFSDATFERVDIGKKDRISVVYGILTDKDNRIWFSTNNGLFRYTPETEQTLHFTSNDGLQSNEFNQGAYYKDDNGIIYFGGIYGLNSFDPSNLKFSNKVPPIAITGITVNNRNVPLKHGEDKQNTITLKHEQNYLNINFSVLDYATPERNTYSYMLEGYDIDWSPVSTQRYAQYPNLPPGKYLFKVQGANSDGVWNKEGAQVFIIIAPAFWQTIWFKVIIGSLIVMFIVLLLKVRFDAYRDKQQHLEDKIKAQEQRLENELLRNEYAVSKALIEGQNIEQKRISEDLHDGLGQVLTAANLNLSALEHELKEMTPKQQEYLSSLRKLVNHAIMDIRDISHNLMPSLIDEEGLEAALDELCNRITKFHNIDISFQVEDLDEHLDNTIEISLYRIVQEVVNNTVKHAGATRLSIHLSQKNNTIHLITNDDGIGFQVTKTNKQNGLGLRNIAMRTELLKGKYSITSAPGKGTSVSITIPLQETR